MRDKIFQKSVLLKAHTTYKIGGPAKYFFNAKNKEDLIRAVKTAKELKLPIFILAGGSNVLVADKGFNGLVIKIQMSKSKCQKNEIYAEAGVKLSSLVRLATENGFSGMEWAAGIPGTIGGAIYGNAQAFGDKISDSVESVEVLDLKNLKTKKLSKKQCNFSLKNSIFKRDKNLIIISVLLKLKKGDKTQIQKKIIEYLNYRKKNHPTDYPSAGSVFINPEVAIKNRNILEKFPELKEFDKRGVMPAGYLIEKAGLKGKKIGGAEISKKHANFIINLGQAKAKDVLALINLAKKEVKKIFGIKLETEVQLVGF